MAQDIVRRQALVLQCSKHIVLPESEIVTEIQRMYVCMFHHIKRELLWSIDNAFILSKNNELTLNGIYILNYSVPFKNSTVRTVYKFNSQFQGKFQTIFDLVNDKLVNIGFNLFDGEFKWRRFSKRGINTGR